MKSKLEKYFRNRLTKVQVAIMLIVGLVSFVWTGSLSKALLFTIISYLPSAVLVLLILIVELKFLRNWRLERVMSKLGGNGLLSIGFQRTSELFFEGVLDPYYFFVGILSQSSHGYLFYFETCVKPINLTKSKLEELSQKYEIEHFENQFYSLKTKLENRRKAPDEKEISKILNEMKDTLIRMELQPAQ